MIGFSWLMLLWATPALTAPAQHEVALAAFRQALQQKETTLRCPSGKSFHSHCGGAKASIRFLRKAFAPMWESGREIPWPI